MDFDSPIMMLEDNPLVSVIIPTKDRPDFLRESLNSVLGQTYRHFEVIIINDGGVGP